MISRGLIELIFSASSIQRWNDHPRIEQFTEMGKQAHKMIIAYFIARCEEDRGRVVDWDRLIRHGFFAFLHRVLVTDIKPHIFRHLTTDKKLRRRFNNWVYRQLSPLLSPLPGKLDVQCREYLLSGENAYLEDRILGAAHIIATGWEFRFIYHWSQPLYGIENTKNDILGQIKAYRDFAAVEELLSGPPDKGMNALVSLIGQLGFQKRWAQIPRMPATSVLGHLMMVAFLSWLAAIEAGTGRVRRRNCFYGGLFHDLPEVLTRDIISPVKTSVKGLDDLIKELEYSVMEESLFPLLPTGWRNDICYLVMNEFENRLRRNGEITIVRGEFTEEQAADENDPVDGKIIEICDKFSAYVEAKESIRIGVQPPQLFEASTRIFDAFAHKSAAGFNASQIFDCVR